MSVAVRIWRCVPAPADGWKVGMKTRLGSGLAFITSLGTTSQQASRSHNPGNSINTFFTSAAPFHQQLHQRQSTLPTKTPPLNQSQLPWVLCGLNTLVADTPAEESSSTSMALAARLSDSPLADSAASARVSH
ncbi:hypothetical protein BU16DRAFT_166657 [Lophium mytilinum]|uniref:Uncharacterized protein n=1 Tax=Lophium mytilinum TaxID=390894 RepID=A0A6A6QCK9_9PEZI|nr:hypothetical protein BU16DRAFT_166657 [Lophium mytilinum]